MKIDFWDLLRTVEKFHQERGIRDAAKSKFGRLVQVLKFYQALQ